MANRIRADAMTREELHEIRRYGAECAPQGLSTLYLDRLIAALEAAWNERDVYKQHLARILDEQAECRERICPVCGFIHDIGNPCGPKRRTERTEPCPICKQSIVKVYVDGELVATGSSCTHFQPLIQRGVK